MKPILQQIQQEAKQNVKNKPVLTKQLVKNIKIAQLSMDKVRALIKQTTRLHIEKQDLLKYYMDSKLS